MFWLDESVRYWAWESLCNRRFGVVLRRDSGPVVGAGLSTWFADSKSSRSCSTKHPHLCEIARLQLSLVLQDSPCFARHPPGFCKVLHKVFRIQIFRIWMAKPCPSNGSLVQPNPQHNRVLKFDRTPVVPTGPLLLSSPKSHFYRARMAKQCLKLAINNGPPQIGLLYTRAPVAKSMWLSYWTNARSKTSFPSIAQIATGTSAVQ
jgi:hypothetical protein